MKIRINSSSRALILIMIALVAIGALIATVYYRSANRSIDPRIVEARELYSQYNSRAQKGNYYSLFSLLDSIENIYSSYSHYRSSYEQGVLMNNRAAAQITIALYTDDIRIDYNPFSRITKDSILTLAEGNLRKAIDIYESWMKRFRDKDEETISAIIKEEFEDMLDCDDMNMCERYLSSRVKEILASVEEGDRRLSVCYTNLGVIMKQKKDYHESLRYYEKALKLWDRNLDAENNINAMLGRPLKKRNLIQKLFPPAK